MHRNESDAQAIASIGFHVDVTDNGTRWARHRVPNMLGQLGQDWWVWANHARFMRRRGLYVDLAANDAMVISNSFFLDRCLGWAGLCIEPNSAHWPRLRAGRSCRLDTRCASDKPEASQLSANNNDNNPLDIQGRAHIGPAARSWERTVKVECDTFANIVRPLHRSTASPTLHIDVLSLDIEGYEPTALRGFNWSEVEIDIVICENPRVGGVLVQQMGYRVLRFHEARAVSERVYLRPGFELGIEVAARRILEHYNRSEPSTLPDELQQLLLEYHTLDALPALRPSLVSTACATFVEPLTRSLRGCLTARAQRVLKQFGSKAATLSASAPLPPPPPPPPPPPMRSPRHPGRHARHEQNAAGCVSHETARDRVSCYLATSRVT